MIENVRVTKRAKDQLSHLKRHTRIKNWNVLCRWALCLSLAEESPPRKFEAGGDGGIEMTWKTFGGDLGFVYLALVRQRCIEDGVEPTPENVETQLRRHIHRGIRYLAGDRSVRSIDGLLVKVEASRA